MAMHESQSRFYENILGRSKSFCRFLFPKLQEIFPEQMQGHDWEEFYRAVNKAQPSLIRTEADELTYCLHVMVRYELEKRVMERYKSITLNGYLYIKDMAQRIGLLYKTVINPRCVYYSLQPTLATAIATATAGTALNSQFTPPP